MRVGKCDNCHRDGVWVNLAYGTCRGQRFDGEMCGDCFDELLVLAPPIRDSETLKRCQRALGRCPAEDDPSRQNAVRAMEGE